MEGGKSHYLLCSAIKQTMHTPPPHPCPFGPPPPPPPPRGLHTEFISGKSVDDVQYECNHRLTADKQHLIHSRYWRHKSRPNVSPAACQRAARAHSGEMTESYVFVVLFSRKVQRSGQCFCCVCCENIPPRHIGLSGTGKTEV